MKKYYRLRLGGNSEHVDECYKNNFVGVSFGFTQNLENDLTENSTEFNQKFVPVQIEKTGRTKIAAGQACASVWKVIKGIQKGDVIVCPDGKNGCLVGEIISDYVYAPDTELPQRREIKWHRVSIEKVDMSPELRSSVFTIGTLRDISAYGDEIELLLNGGADSIIQSTDTQYFRLEKHLEDFLVNNWQQTELGKEYDIFTNENDEIIGQQYPCDTGYIDILAISKDKQELLVVELKRGKCSDVVVGQIQRYMGFVQSELATPSQTVKGIIIGLDDDLRIKRALSVTSNIEFYRYELSFKLTKN
jgi:restriction system protein